MRLTQAEALAGHEEFVGAAYRAAKGKVPDLGRGEGSVTVIECESTTRWAVLRKSVPDIARAGWTCPICGTMECGWRFYSFTPHGGAAKVGATDMRDHAWLGVEVGQVRADMAAETSSSWPPKRPWDWYYAAQVNHDGKVWINW